MHAPPPLSTIRNEGPRHAAPSTTPLELLRSRGISSSLFTSSRAYLRNDLEASRGSASSSIPRLDSRKRSWWRQLSSRVAVGAGGTAPRWTFLAPCLTGQPDAKRAHPWIADSQHCAPRARLGMMTSSTRAWTVRRVGGLTDQIARKIRYPDIRSHKSSVMATASISPRSAA